MSLKFIAIRWATKTDESARVTIPIVLVRDFWKIEKAESFALCFFVQDDKVSLDLPERIIKLLPPEEREKLVEEYRKYRRAEVFKIYLETLEDIVRCEPEIRKRRMQMFFDKLQEMINKDAGLLKERELHFISTGKITGCMASMFLDLQEVEEESISHLLYEIERLKTEIKSITSSLKELDLMASKGYPLQPDMEHIRRVLEYRYRILMERLEKITRTAKMV